MHPACCWVCCWLCRRVACGLFACTMGQGAARAAAWCMMWCAGRVAGVLCVCAWDPQAGRCVTRVMHWQAARTRTATATATLHRSSHLSTDLTPRVCCDLQLTAICCARGARRPLADVRGRNVFRVRARAVCMCARIVLRHAAAVLSWRCCAPGLRAPPALRRWRRTLHVAVILVGPSLSAPAAWAAACVVHKHFCLGLASVARATRRRHDDGPGAPRCVAGNARGHAWACVSTQGAIFAVAWRSAPMLRRHS